ncbi:unnamed protein product [Symbiodinium necroappetens]|uniref:Uncharacterized protein n=1 Tax=Symbiodinium necroappetens TaxID=1628268 RepID=A0A812PCX5_9DINO|nr:unnamed protein product [Symbiodinium necroappetens]
MATNDAPLTDWLFKVTDSLDQHFICRNVECSSVIHNHHWLRQISTDYPIREQHGRYTCPRCLTPYRPHADRTNASALQSKKLVPAQKALIMAENGEVNIDIPVRGQTISKDNTDYHLFLMEWEKTDDDMLLGRLKQIMAEYRADLGTDDFRAPLQAAIRDQAVKYQLLGYFEETAWTLENMENILNRNYSVDRKNIYRPDLLPTMTYPRKYLDETFNTKENFESYDIRSFRKDPPYYHFSVYQYEPDSTVTMKQNDFLGFMSLCYIQLRAIQYLQGDHSFTNVSHDHLELLRDADDNPVCKILAMQEGLLFIDTGPEAPSLHDSSPGPNILGMDTAALRHLESLVDGLNRQINGLRFRIEAIRTRLQNFELTTNNSVNNFISFNFNSSLYSDYLLLSNSYTMKWVIWLERFFLSP